MSNEAEMTFSAAFDALASALDRVAGDAAETRRLVAERLHRDEAKERAFDRLYAELEQHKRQQAVDFLKPLYLDIALVIDRLDGTLRAFDDHPPTIEEARSFSETLRGELIEVLQRRGVEPIRDDGGPFNPRVQRAVGTRDVAAADEQNTIIETVRTGYRSGDQIIRPSEVIVGRLSLSHCEARSADGPCAVPDDVEPGEAAPATREDLHE